MEKIKYLYPSDNVRVSREEQDRQEVMFQLLQSQLHKGTITEEGFENLFNIIHNCTLSQLKKRSKGLSKKGAFNGLIDSMEERLENFALDGTISLIESMKKGRYVRYIIKTSDYLALYSLHNARQKFNDLLEKSSMDINFFLKKIEEESEIEFSESGEMILKTKTKGGKTV